MTKKPGEEREQLERLRDALARDVDHMSEKELLVEVAENFGDPEIVVGETRKIIQSALAAHGRRRLMAARQSFDALPNTIKPRVIELSMNQKQALIKWLADNNGQLGDLFTMAARNKNDLEADMDSILEDLIELGVIDERGNLK